MYKILLVDDEELILKSLSYLTDWGKFGFCIADTASSGKEAYEKITELEPDLVMTDIRMQGFGGLELMQMVKAQKPEIQFIILSGYAEFTYAKKALEMGAAGFAVKPFQQEEIESYLKKVKAALDQQKKLNRTLKSLEEQKAQTARNGQTEERKNQTWLELVSYVEEHYMEDISPGALAERFHVNAAYVSQLFKKEKGITCTEYLTGLRIRRACRLLRMTDDKVTEIAGKVGFRDYFYFTRVFKKIMGMSPSEYRGDEE